ncbi:hypothetical protein M2202_006191 [Bradyrhizobium japonicum]|jgi:hypothetical protein|nr:hypothetical protein [Bradyrhizobium japonicum]MCP1787137.1 hypothetical protein [Bradyrhizobium japonicum]MCP1809014.1 hypothetical protein [Bradyrhizobium japonicum]MCP1817944.1 hypothetical protein [Bradyrhizobium japonicum]MCP1870544.1 hypothetical protein [Bradyrhizobium japonicum]
MPVRPAGRAKRRRSAHITPEAVALFRRGMRAPHDQHIRIALAAALGRSKFRASPLDLEPRSLIGGDPEPADVVLELRTQLLSKIRRGFFK